MPSSATESPTGWVESLELFGMQLGLERMRGLLARLGNPERRYRAVHVVGTNGKTSTVRAVEAVLAAEGLCVGAYTSPHVTGWPERIRVGGEEADFEAAVERVRRAAEELGATQFEVVTAAALAAFAAAGVDVAVVEAGLGGRLDATNVLAAAVVVLTNVGLEHTEHLGATREEIAREKLAVVSPGATVVLGEPEWEPLAREHRAERVVAVRRDTAALAVAAAEAFVGHAVDAAAARDVAVPGRLERVGESPLEIWDGAHNPDGVAYLVAHLPRRRFTLVLSILEDKDVDAMLAAYAALGDHLVATSSANGRALPADDLARRAARFFARVEAVPDPVAARERARAAAGPDGAVLVSGSLYLLASLANVRMPALPWPQGSSASG